ncbi:MAG TPA: VWA domain-containing protein [Ohtaekwangia sp.]
MTCSAVRILLFCILTIVLHYDTSAQEVDTGSVYKIADLELKSFQEFIGKKLTYPEDARIRVIQGTVYIRFMTDVSGKIIPTTAKAIGSLYPSLDREAERVVSLYTLPLVTIKDRTPVKHAVFILPVNFKLTDSPWPLEFPAHQLDKPLRTVVIDKVNTGNPLWSLYAWKGMNQPITKISPGDSVTITGWAAWSYFVQSEKGTGYISHKALFINKELDSLSKVVAERSPAEEELENSRAQPNFSDTLDMSNTETAFLSLTANKKSIFAGECVTFTLAFNVHEKNRVSLSFHNLANQLTGILDHQLNIANCLVTDARIENIEPVELQQEDEKLFQYPIYRAAYCPVKPMTINVSSIPLQMLIHNINAPRMPNLGVFKSKPVALTVKPLPVGNSMEVYDITGEFSTHEEISEKEIRTGEPFQYTFTISGNGLTYTIDPPKIKVTAGLQSQLVDVIDTDTIVGQDLLTSKTFVYEMILEKEGAFDFSPLFSFRVFNPAITRVQVLYPDLEIVVHKGTDQRTLSKRKYPSNNLVIAFDISESMEIEDYHPSRLQVVKDGINKFLESRRTCDVGVIFFGGNVKRLNAGVDGCFTTESLDTLSSKHVKPGTAMGDAVFLAVKSLKENDGVRKLVIIGDGDNTTGVYPLLMATTLASQHGLKIYAIGIGTRGMVSHGKDSSGRSQMYDNTFTDVDLKTMAAQTGGTYTWAKDATEISKILTHIFSK